MKYLFLSVILLATTNFCHGGPLRIQKRAAFYVANETACVVDDTVYSIDDPIPTDNPCETCRCRPPGFACVLANCLRRLGCKAVERPGQCCPDYICGCEYNGRMYSDGEEISNSDDPCITCHCLGSSTVCSTGVCPPPPPKANCVSERVTGECCPRYTNCSYVDSDIKATTPSDKPIVIETHPDEESSHAVNIQLSKNPPFQEAPDRLYASVTLEEGFTPEIQERGSSSSSPAPKETETTPQSVQDADKTESDSSETNNKPQLLNTDSEVAPNVEPKDPAGDDISKPAVADSDGLVPIETDASKINTEIFPDGTVEELKSDPTTPTQDIPPSDPITTQVPTKIEKDIETNTIEKRFRSLQNVTSEDTTESTEKNEPLDAITAKNTEVPEAGVTEVQEQQSAFQVTETSTPVTDSHTESLESGSNDASISTEFTTDAGKSLEKFHFAVEKIPVPESTVTAVVNVHEETTGPEEDEKVVTSVSPTAELELSSEISVTKETDSSEEVEKSQSN